MQTIIVFSTLESSWRMFSPQSRVSIKSGGLSEPPLFPPTIDLGLSPSWLFFGRFEKAARWSLLEGEAILIPEDGRGSPKGWLLVSQSEEPVLPAAVAVKCALALCTVHQLQSSTSLVSTVQVCPQRPSLVAAAPPRPPVQLQSGFRIGRRCSTKTKTR